MRWVNLKFKYLSCESWGELKSESVYMHESFLKFSFSGQMRTKLSWWKLISDGWILLIKRAKTLINYNIIKLWASSIKSIMVDEIRSPRIFRWWLWPKYDMYLVNKQSTLISTSNIYI
jgi:hypothetical protein